MNDRPRGAKEFQRLLQRHAADIDQLPQRVMHLVRIGVVCAFLDDTRHDDGAHLFIVKGGTAMQLRFGITARATTDLDVVFRGRVDQWIDSTRRSSTTPGTGSASTARTTPSRSTSPVPATNHGESHSRSATKAETSAASPSKSPSTTPPPTDTNSSSPKGSLSPSSRSTHPAGSPASTYPSRSHRNSTPADRRHDASSISTGSFARRHSGKPSASRRAARPRRCSRRTASSAITQYGPRQ